MSDQVQTFFSSLHFRANKIVEQRLFLELEVDFASVGQSLDSIFHARRQTTLTHLHLN